MIYFHMNGLEMYENFVPVNMFEIKCIIRRLHNFAVDVVAITIQIHYST